MLNKISMKLATILAVQGASTFPASADTWWEIGDQTLYFEDGIDGMGVLVYLTDTNEPNPNFKLFIGEMEDIYFGRKDYEARAYYGYMANYASDQDCGPSRVDAYGQSYSNWSYAELTFGADWQHFTLVLDHCGEGDYIETLQGTPGQ